MAPIAFEIFEGFLLPDSYPILVNPEIIYLFELFIGESIDISWAELISLNCCCPVLEYKVVLPKVFNSSCLSNVLCFVQKSD